MVHWATIPLTGHGENTYRFEATGCTLSSVLDEVGVGEIDLLTLDVEGHEATALRGLDLTRHAPRYALVEILDAEATRLDVEAAISRRYVPIRWFSPHDLLFVRDYLLDGHPVVAPGGPSDIAR
jgi:hypothetical protein